MAQQGKKDKRLIVVSRRQPWDADAFARVIVAHVLQQIEQQIEAAPESLHGDEKGAG